MGTNQKTPPRSKRPTAAERKRREAQAQAAAEKNGNVPEAQPADGVFVQRVPNDNGDGYSTTVTAIGDVRITEIETLLKLGLKGFRQQAGLDE